MEIKSITNIGNPCRIVTSGISLEEFKEIAKQAGASIKFDDLGGSELSCVAEKRIVNDILNTEYVISIGFWIDEDNQTFWSR